MFWIFNQSVFRSYGYDQNQYAPSNNAAPAASYGVYDSAPQTGQNYYYGGNVFIPKYDANGATGKKGEDYENEPPLLEGTTFFFYND